MGTHPIFESDFDCLTATIAGPCCRVSLCGQRYCCVLLLPLPAACSRFWCCLPDMNALFRSRRHPVQVKVTTQAEVLDFQVYSRDKVKDIFDRVCNAISVREKWFFGLAVETNEGLVWLKHNKELMRQPIQTENGAVHIKLLVKYYPESVEDELVLPNTQNLFYLQLKHDVITGRLRVAEPEAAVLLASYHIQAQLGLRGLSVEESKLEYVKLCAKIINFGVIYFLIKVGKDFETSIDHWIGISSYGINLYSTEDKLNPKKNWAWTQVDDLNYKGRCFSIRPSHAKKDEKRPDEEVFYAESAAINEIILELCQGNHDLFFQRRRADTIEIQQMKQTAREEKDRRKTERAILNRERDARRIAELEKRELHEKLNYYHEQMFKLQEERDKQSLHSERKVLHSEEINLMQLQLSQKDAIIDDLKMRLSRQTGETERLRGRVDSLEKQRATTQQHNEYVNFNFDKFDHHRAVAAAATAAGKSHHIPNNPFADFRKETKSDSQEQVKHAIDYYYKFNRESERIKMEYSDQQLKMEAGFNQIRQDLENDQVNGVVTSPPEPPCYPYPTATGSPSTTSTSNGNQTNVEENDNNYN